MDRGMKHSLGARWLDWLPAMACLGISGLLSACVQVRTEPIRIEPIYIEITVNHKIQKELDDLFADIDMASETADYAPIEASANKEK